MKDSNDGDEKYQLVRRTHSGFKVRRVPNGDFTFSKAHYLMLPELDKTACPQPLHKHLFSFQGEQLPDCVHPGRGMGFGDVPNLKIIGDVDPSDIGQGSVGDCWLLSGIAAIAEFDGAIWRLFRNTPELHSMPLHGFN